mgnify:CR=1 FL=1
MKDLAQRAEDALDDLQRVHAEHWPGVPVSVSGFFTLDGDHLFDGGVSEVGPFNADKTGHRWVRVTLHPDKVVYLTPKKMGHPFMVRVGWPGMNEPVIVR